MRISYPRYLVHSALAISAATIPTEKAVTQADVGVLSARSTAAENIDPRFSLTFQFDKPLLPITSCLMNAVYATQELALGNFTEHVNPSIYALPDYPTASVVTEATTISDTVERRYLIWGIWKGMFYMMKHNQFQNALFTLHWDGAVVGYVIFANSEGQLSSHWSNITHEPLRRSEAQSLSSTVIMALPRNSTRSSLAVSADDQKLEVSLTLSGQALTVYELFITILSGLAYLAEVPGMQKVEDFSLSPATYDVTLLINDESEQLSPNSPVLEARWLIMALGLVPQYIVERRDFREVVLDLSVDSQPVGQVYIEKGTSQTD